MPHDEQGVVQRLSTSESGMPFVEYRTRDAALFAETEWGWSRLAADAFIFPRYAAATLPSHACETSAESHAAALKAAGDLKAYPAVHGHDAREKRKLDRASRDAGMEAQVRAFNTPEDVYAETSRRLGERGE